MRVYASPYTPEFCDWGFSYEGGREDRFNRRGETFSDVESLVREEGEEGANGGNGGIPSRRRRREDGESEEEEGEANANDIDIVLTHGPPYKRLDPTATVPAVGCPMLLKAVMRARPKLCCFGHIHEGWGAERVKWAGAGGALAGEVAGGRRKVTVGEWTEGGVWEEGVEGVERVEVVDFERMGRERGVYLDVSDAAGAAGGSALREGEETVFVNAAVMDVGYRPVNAPWVVDLELRRAGGGEGV